MAWSETLLDDAERSALRRLGVFVGGFSLEAAEAVLGAFDDTDAYEVLDLVGRLVDKSLVALDEVSGRYRMLETIRSFALARLLGRGRRRRRARRAPRVGDRVRARARRPRDERTAEWFESFAVEWPNMAAALDWAVDRPEDRCALVAALGVFWLTRATHGRRRQLRPRHHRTIRRRPAAVVVSSGRERRRRSGQRRAWHDRLRPFVEAAAEIARDERRRDRPRATRAGDAV